MIIDSVGKHPVNGQYVSYFEVKKDDEGKLRVWFGSADRATESSPGIDLHEGWFVYGESQTRFWIFDGDSDLELLEYSGSPGDEKQSSRRYSPDEIPGKILPKLPGGGDRSGGGEGSGAGQPASRSGPDPEGGEAPQPESEEGSR